MIAEGNDGDTPAGGTDAGSEGTGGGGTPFNLRILSRFHDFVQRILSDFPELPVDIGLNESAVSPEPVAMRQAGEMGCFLEIAVLLLYKRVDRKAWIGENKVRLLAEEAGNFAVVRWAVELGCHRNPNTTYNWSALAGPTDTQF